MSNPELPKKADNETLRQLPLEQLVSMIVQQQQVIEQQQQVIEHQQKAIEELTQTVNLLKVSQSLNSQISSKPPSTDRIKKSEKAKESSTSDFEASKRKPGGQPGHPGKTRSRIWESRPLRSLASLAMFWVWESSQCLRAGICAGAASGAVSRAPD